MSKLNPLLDPGPITLRYLRSKFVPACVDVAGAAQC